MKASSVLMAGLAVLAVTVAMTSFWGAVSNTYGVQAPEIVSNIASASQGFADVGSKVKDAYLKYDPSSAWYAKVGALFNFFQFMLFDITKMLFIEAPLILASIFSQIAAVLHVPTELVSVAMLILVVSAVMGVLGK